MLRLFAITLLALPLGAQDILDLRGGLIYHAEDCVYLDAAHVKPIPHALYRLKDGDTLATGEGFAEVLAGMGNIFRIGPETTVRFAKLGFRETEVELLHGLLVWDGRGAIEPGTVRLRTPGGMVTMNKNGELWAFVGDDVEFFVQKGRWTATVDGQTNSIPRTPLADAHSQARVGVQQMQPWHKARVRAATQRRVDRMREADEAEKRRYDPLLYR